MKLFKYLGMLLLQFVGMAAITYAMFSTLFISNIIYSVCAWALWPVAGLFSAYMVTVKGVNNYLAWLAPPLAGILAHYLAFFYMPSSAGPFLICAVSSIVGAAAGDVKKKFDRK
ncbi:MAG: hypothetical protein IJC56_09640 [Clostridia bacterium]|nr:hypothetical protein [Clostridia bacterium]